MVNLECDQHGGLRQIRRSDDTVENTRWSLNSISEYLEKRVKTYQRLFNGMFDHGCIIERFDVNFLRKGAFFMFVSHCNAYNHWKAHNGHKPSNIP
jgi:hypothetical protein